MELRRVFDIQTRLSTHAPKDDLLLAKENKEWVKYSYRDFAETSRHLASALLKSGIREGEKVAIMAGNSPQWNFIDFGCQLVNVVTVPIYPTISNDDLRFILQHAEVRLIFISEVSGWKKLAALEKELPLLEQVVAVRPIPGVKDFSGFIASGKEHHDQRRIDEISARITPEDVYTILYTSGTTGQPKGVMITHNNMLSNVMICRDIAPFRTTWRALSFLPLNHVYERFLNTLYLYHGVSIYYAESFETIGDNCREIHPHMFVAVPRILERVLERISSAGEKLSGFKRKIFNWSFSLAERYELNGANGFFYEFQRKLADKLVYRKWRDAVGGKVEVIVSGGAALNPRLERIFTCAGFNLLQGYGLTETCVVVAVNRFGMNDRHFGTVGPVVENTEVRIAKEDGEILVKGPSVMKGYYLNESATHEALDADGWLHTGDIGEFVDGRFLKITDRKKEIFKTSAGKYISPVLIENKLKECKYIEQCMVIGDGQKFASAIIVPSKQAFSEYCISNGIGVTGDQYSTHAELQRIINDHVRKVNATLGTYEQLKRHKLADANWSVETGEITPKLSLKRKVISTKYADLIREIFKTES